MLSVLFHKTSHAIAPPNTCVVLPRSTSPNRQASFTFL